MAGTPPNNDILAKVGNNEVGGLNMPVVAPTTNNNDNKKITHNYYFYNENSTKVDPLRMSLPATF